MVISYVLKDKSKVISSDILEHDDLLIIVHDLFDLSRNVGLLNVNWQYVRVFAINTIVDALEPVQMTKKCDLRPFKFKILKHIEINMAHLS